MFIEQIPADAIATTMFLYPRADWAGRPEVVGNTLAEVTAPFRSTQNLRIFKDDIRALAIRQQYLEGSSALNLPVSFRIEDEGLVEDRSPAVLVQKLRRLSGLTWAQVAEIFGVSQRTPYHWASGKAVSVENHQCLGNVVAMLQFADRGSAEENRNLLRGNTQNGQTFFELLCRGEFELFRDLAGKGAGRPQFDQRLTTAAAKYNAPSHWGKSTELFAADADVSEILPVSQPKLRRAKVRRNRT